MSKTRKLQFRIISPAMLLALKISLNEGDQDAHMLLSHNHRQTRPACKTVCVCVCMLYLPLAESERAHVELLCLNY